MEMYKSYVYEDQEVKWTGRVAAKNPSTATNRIIDKSPDRVRISTLVEIVPTDGASWKKWVRECDLFCIIEK